MSLKKEDLMSHESFCILPWIHAHCAPDGAIHLCCASSKPLMDNEGRELNLQTHSLKTIFNAEHLKTLRKKLLNGERITHCDTCWQKEKLAPANSHRFIYNTLWLSSESPLSDHNFPALIEKHKENNIVTTPLSVDYRLGNICNLKCQICNAGNSSQIEKDKVHSAMNGGGYRRLNHRFNTSGEWYEAKELKQELIDFGQNVQHIKLAGGEPTINRALMQWLEDMVKTRQAHKTKLSMATNFTTGNKKIYEMISNFKQINFSLSIDGFGAVNEYLRYPSRWETIERNVEFVRQVEKKTNISLTICPVINVYNALSITKLLEWADGYSFKKLMNFVRGVDHIGCTLLPPTVRQEVIARIKSYLDRNKIPDGQPEKIYALAVCKHFETNWSEHKLDSELQKFCDFTRYMDSMRRIAFRESCPETYQEMTSYYGPEFEEALYKPILIKPNVDGFKKVLQCYC